jgi:hypothetical protein
MDGKSRGRSRGGISEYEYQGCNLDDKRERRGDGPRVGRRYDNRNLFDECNDTRSRNHHVYIDQRPGRNANANSNAYSDTDTFPGDR